MRKLQKIGATRWWSNEKSLTSGFGGDDCLFTIVINALDYVDNCGKFDPKTTSEAVSLIIIDELCEFHVLKTAHIYLKIFSLVRRTSTYLQSKNLDLVAAWEMFDKKLKVYLQ